MTKFFIYDNDIRRYRPDPDQTVEDVDDTKEIEENIGYLRKIDIGDAYLDGERDHIALRFRAIPNIEGMPRRNQEHYAYWILDLEGNDDMYEDIPISLKSLFNTDNESWEYADQETNSQSVTDVTDPKRIIEVWNRGLGRANTNSEQNQKNKSRIESHASTLRSVQTSKKEFLKIGFPSFDDALELLIEMKDTSLTIVVGDLNKPEEVTDLNPDIVVEYNEEYKYFEQLNSYAEQEFSEIVSQEVINSIDASLNSLREESDGWRAEIETINMILSCIQHQGRNHDPASKTENLTADQFSRPAHSVASDLKKLHKTYNFDKTQNNLTRALIPSFIYNPQSPYDELAEKLENRLETIETEIYDNKTTEIIDVNRIKPSITYISEQLDEESQEVRDSLYDSIVEKIDKNIYSNTKTDSLSIFQLFISRPLYLGGLIFVICIFCFVLGVIVATSYSVPNVSTLI